MAPVFETSTPGNRFSPSSSVTSPLPRNAARLWLSVSPLCRSGSGFTVTSFNCIFFGISTISTFVSFSFNVSLFDAFS